MIYPSYNSLTNCFSGLKTTLLYSTLAKSWVIDAVEVDLSFSMIESSDLSVGAISAATGDYNLP